jgi:hypothetical protein
MTALADLLVTQSVSQIFNTLLGVYQANGFPVTAWQVGGVERTRLMAIATALADVSGQYIPAIAGGSLLDYSPNYPGWTALTAAQIFELAQNLAGFTFGNIVAANTAASAYPFTAGQLIFVFGTSRRRYICTGSGTIPASGGGSLTIPVIADNAGSVYTEPTSSADITLVTPLPGVTLTNPPPTPNYASPTGTHGGSGTGTITAGGAPVGPHSLVVNITSTGQTGVATFSYSLDGAAFVAAGAVSSLTNVGGTGINITLANGAINPSFVIGDTYSFTTPGSWITSQGSDIETDTALAARCRNRWSSLSAIPTQSLYQLLATSTPSVGSQVTQCFVAPDATINNKINVVVSGPGGVLPGATITAIQAYINPRTRLCDNPVVQSPSTLAVTIAFSYTVPSSLQAAASASITAALQAYMAAVGVNATIRIAAIVELVMEVNGVVDCTGVTINGVAANLTLGSPSTFVLPAYPPTINATAVNI